MVHDTTHTFGAWFVMLTNIEIGFDLKAEATGLFFAPEKSGMSRIFGLAYLESKSHQYFTNRGIVLTLEASAALPIWMVSLFLQYHDETYH